MKTLGQKITELRKLKHMTQEDLATQLNVSSQAVSKWENDLSIPDITVLIELADFFQVSLDELLRQKESTPVVQMVPVEVRKPLEQLMFKIIVDKPDGEKIRVNLPMKLVKAALEIGLTLPSVTNNSSLQGIDLNKIMELVDAGCIGKLVEVDESDGSHVEITIE